MRAAGFVLVGGQSKRMGRDKSLLPWRSGTLAEHLAAQVRAAAGSAHLVGGSGRHKFMNADCLPDLRPGRGPLSGIETALASRRGELNLILACDQPAISLEWLQKLLEAARRTGAECTATRDRAGRAHPLCAVYHADCLPAVTAALDNGFPRVLDLLNGLRTVFLESPDGFLNINTPEDWAEACKVSPR